MDRVAAGGCWSIRASLASKASKKSCALRLVMKLGLRSEDLDRR